MPVAFTQEQKHNPPDHHELTDYHFTPSPNAPTIPAAVSPLTVYPVTRVSQITIALYLDTSPGHQQDKQVQVEAPFHIKGSFWNKDVLVSPLLTDQAALAQAMTYAYWDFDEHNHDGQTQENFDDLLAQMSWVIAASLGDPTDAFRQKLKQYADRFHTQVPAPDTEISASSQDGHITITYNPVPTSQTG